MLIAPVAPVEEVRIRQLCPLPQPSARDLLKAVAVARGCTTPEALRAFFTVPDKIDNPITSLTGYAPARDRIKAAIAAQEKITIYGDYDVDGMTSLVLMLDLLRSAGAKNVRVFAPDRVEDDYGLTISGVTKCLESHQPSLIITVDCGSPSLSVIADLKTKGVDTIVIDHHGLPPYEGKHSALAHLNPKDKDANGTDEMRAMSAAGLVYLFAEAFAEEQGVRTWDQHRAMIMGGLGTMVDVMPLSGLNRTLVKSSLELANRGDLLVRLPGLELLRDKCSVGEINSWAYGFVFGPHLNATGRVANAKVSIQLLGAHSTAAAEPFVDAAIARNTERKEIQKVVQEQAEAQVANQMAYNPERRVVVLADKGWHPGVVGIVAGRIKEQIRRPVFVCGWNEEGFWKGSGRSVPGIELGELVHEAVKAGVLKGGGGHAMAAGIKIEEDGLAALTEWLDAKTKDLPLDLSREYEVLAEADLCPVHKWHEVFRQLEPFGNGNPRPNLWMSKGLLLDEPKVLTKRADGKAWAVVGMFQGPNGGKIRITWKDVGAAQACWRVGGSYRLILSLTRTNSRGQQYDNWDVQHCEPVAVAA